MTGKFKSEHYILTGFNYRHSFDGKVMTVTYQLPDCMTEKTLHLREAGLSQIVHNNYIAPQNGFLYSPHLKKFHEYHHLICLEDQQTGDKLSLYDLIWNKSIRTYFDQYTIENKIIPVLPFGNLLPQ